jgi:ferredoxin
MPTFTLDNQKLTVEPGTTILAAAAAAGVRIPTLCHLDSLPAQTSCMVCVVKVLGEKRLLPACATVVRDGMVVESDSDEVHAARRTALELLLGDHLGDCRGPCQLACPAHLEVPVMLRTGDIAGVKAHQPLPAVLGRICAAPCEKGCRRAQWDTAVSIRAHERRVGDADLASPYTPPLPPLTGFKVAIIGAGPAGLTAAYMLRRRSVACTVFDDHLKPGGMLQYGVPEETLPRDLLQAELATLLLPDITLRLNVRVGETLHLDALRREYSAVLITAGAGVTFGLPATERGITVDKHTLMTSEPGLFAAGGAIAPLRQAVRAVGDGGFAAKAIVAYLTRQPAPAHRPAAVSHYGRLHHAELAELAADVAREPRSDAPADAARCLRCDCRALETCKLLQHAAAYGAAQHAWDGERRTFAWDRSHAEIIYEPGKCIDCGLCVRIASREELGLAFVGRGFTVRVAVPFEATLADALRETALACAEACPTGALAKRR